MQPDDANAIAAAILEASADHEFTTFVVGFTREEPYDRDAHEQRYRALKVAVSGLLLKRWPGRSIDFVRPQARIEVACPSGVRMRTSPLFVAGRYRKLSRDIPSSRWDHHACKGAGCECCGYSGRLCGPSVEEIVSDTLLSQVGGAGTLLHVLGREDTDARMLGRGRPFVVEVQMPVRRTVDLSRWIVETARRGRGMAEILAASVVEPDAVALVKETAAEKSYRAWIQLEAQAPDDAAERVASLSARTIDQLSPARVMHRRGRHSLRQRRIVTSNWLGIVDGLWVWEVRTQAGAYIKELVSGDLGRTRPSISSVLGCSAHCAALDVIDVHWQGPWESVLSRSSAWAP